MDEGLEGTLRKKHPPKQSSVEASGLGGSQQR